MSARSSNKDKGRLAPFVPVDKEMMSCPAWRAASCGARVLYLHLKGRWSFKRKNNGHVHISGREAEEELGSVRDSISRWFRELQHYGFIVMTEEGCLGVDGKGKAPHWRLTEFEAPGGRGGNTWMLPTKDYLKWDGTKFRDDRGAVLREKNRKQNPGPQMKARVARKSWLECVEMLAEPAQSPGRAGDRPVKSRVRATIRSANLVPGRSEGPARAELEVDCVARIPAATVDAAIAKEAAGSTRWLLAEAWWASQFPIPTFQEIAEWSFEVLPWTFIAHFDRRFRRVWFRLVHSLESYDFSFIVGVVQWARESIFVIAALSLTPVLICLVTALLLLGLIPVDRVRAFVGKIQRAVSATIGDSYVFMRQPIAAAAICQSVSDNLRWLAARCRRVAIVAHSQGGAIAHEVLRGPPAAPCDLLVTFGSGLAKLAEIQRGSSGTARLYLWLASVGGVLAAAGFAGDILVNARFGLSTVLLKVGFTAVLLLEMVGILLFVRGKPRAVDRAKKQSSYSDPKGIVLAAAGKDITTLGKDRLAELDAWAYSMAQRFAPKERDGRTYWDNDGDEQRFMRFMSLCGKYALGRAQFESPRYAAIAVANHGGEKTPDVYIQDPHKVLEDIVDRWIDADEAERAEKGLGPRIHDEQEQQRRIDALELEVARLRGEDRKALPSPPEARAITPSESEIIPPGEIGDLDANKTPGWQKQSWTGPADGTLSWLRPVPPVKPEDRPPATPPVAKSGDETKAQMARVNSDRSIEHRVMGNPRMAQPDNLSSGFFWGGASGKRAW